MVGARDLRERACEALGLSAAHARETARAAAYADESVLLAEELDDPILLAEALGARLTTHSGPEHLDARLGTSLRLLGLVRHSPDPGVRLEAHLWRLTTALEQLDLGTVRRQLAALDLLADETGDPSHRFYACSRRAMFALTEGDTVGAARLSAEAADASAGEVPGADAALHTLHAELARQRGERTALVQHATSCEERGHSRDVASLLAQAAVLWLESGEPERARRLADQLAPALGDLPRDADWLPVICKVSEAAAGSGRRGTAERCARLLAPYAGRGVLESRAVAFSGVVDDYLALATGDREHAASARAAYRRLGADWWARRGPLGRTHEPVTGVEGTRVLHLHPAEADGPTRLWCVGREGADADGAVHARVRVPPPAHRAAGGRRTRSRPGGRGRPDASRAPAPGRSSTSRRSPSTASSCARARPGPSNGVDTPERSEQARAVIRRAIRTALARLELHDGEVAYELRTTIRTGATYRYEPDAFRPVEWRLGTEQHVAQSVGEP